MKQIRSVITLLGIFLMLIVGCSGCTIPQKQELTAQGLTMQLQQLLNYTAEAQITFTKNEKSSTIRVQQSYDMKGPYTLKILEPEHMNGYTTIYDGEKITEYNPINDKTVQVKVSPVKNEVLFGTFVHNYLKSQPTTKEGQEAVDALVLEAMIPGHYKYMANEKVWFDKETGKPIKMEIYGQDGVVTIQIEFLSFEYTIQTK